MTLRHLFCLPLLALWLPAAAMANDPVPSTTSVATAVALREMSWYELMPPVDPEVIKKYESGDLSREEAIAYSKSLGETPVASLDGQKIVIPGYLVPLSMDKDNKAKELLLVPTMGSCIHVPPPPPNQTIYIRYDKGISVTEAGYTPYEVVGTLKVEKNTSTFTDTLYAIEIDSITEF